MTQSVYVVAVSDYVLVKTNVVKIAKSSRKWKKSSAAARVILHAAAAQRRESCVEA